MEYEDLTKTIIGCAYKVHNTMDFGFLESVYEKCMMIELKNTGLKAQKQTSIQVQYEGVIVGEFIADILVEDAVIIELKSVKQIARQHEVQLVNYLVATNKPVGLLLNFAEQNVQVKRKLKDLSPETPKTTS